MTQNEKKNSQAKRIDYSQFTIKIAYEQHLGT